MGLPRTNAKSTTWIASPRRVDEFKNYYKLLGVPRDAGADEIKKAFRKLAHSYHPDVSREADAVQGMSEPNEANAVLSDVEKRAAYDAIGRDRKAGDSFTPAPSWYAGFEFSGGGSPMDDGDHSAFFEELFGRMGSPSSAPPQLSEVSQFGHRRPPATGGQSLGGHDPARRESGPVDPACRPGRDRLCRCGDGCMCAGRSLARLDRSAPARGLEQAMVRQRIVDDLLTHDATPTAKAPRFNADDMRHVRRVTRLECDFNLVPELAHS